MWCRNEQKDDAIPAVRRGMDAESARRGVIPGTIPVSGYSVCGAMRQQLITSSKVLWDDYPVYSGMWVLMRNYRWYQLMWGASKVSATGAMWRNFRLFVPNDDAFECVLSGCIKC